MNTIKFDRKSSSWTHNIESNKFFLHYNIMYLKDLLMARGYLYLNTIYEVFGVEWNPDDENVCYRAENRNFNIIWDELGGNSFLIRIHY